ncbi:unnamed protein product, partial [Ectocarpus fasciculatus]
AGRPTAAIVTARPTGRSRGPGAEKRLRRTNPPTPPPPSSSPLSSPHGEPNHGPEPRAAAAADAGSPGARLSPRPAPLVANPRRQVACERDFGGHPPSEQGEPLLD